MGAARSENSLIKSKLLAKNIAYSDFTLTIKLPNRRVEHFDRVSQQS